MNAVCFRCAKHVRSCVCPGGPSVVRQTHALPKVGDRIVMAAKTRRAIAREHVPVALGEVTQAPATWVGPPMWDPVPMPVDGAGGDE